MCTVTMHSNADGLVITMNRDERIERHETGWNFNTKSSANYAYPVDGISNGSWFGIHSSGIILCLLNRYQDHTKITETSRGEIILQALSQENKITTWLNDEFDAENFNPFRLLVFQQQSIDIFDWDNSTLNHQQILNRPWFITTSSSQNAEFIIPYRQRLFANWLKNKPTQTKIIDFHLRQNSNAKSESILMSRKHSHTKSLTQCIVDNKNRRININYLDNRSLQQLINKTHNQASNLSTRFSFRLDI